MTPNRLMLAALAAFLVLAGCGPEPVRTPANVAGEWVQLDLDGDPLPARREDRYEDRVCVTEMVRSVMSLYADGTFTNSGESRRWCGKAGEPEALVLGPFSVSGRYTLHGPRGDTIRITTPGMEAMPPERRNSLQGTIDGDEMVLTLRNARGPAGVARHRRQ